MATTTNYGWETPDDTDLVKDGAAAIRTLGSSVDTTTKNLNPETTLGDLAYRSATANVNTRLALGTANQVLRVNSGGTAPEWATTADQTPLTTKGDLFGFNTADARIPVGTNGHILTADSAEALGVKWAAPAGGGKLLQLVSATTNTSVSNTTDTAADTGLTAAITPTLNTSKVFVIISQAIECDVSSGNTGTEINATVELFRGATSIWQANRAIMTLDSTTTAHFVAAHISITCLDTPATTSSTTYKTQFKRYNGATRAIAQWGGEMRSTITLMEIGA